MFNLSKEKLSKFAAILLAATSGIGLAVFAYLGTFTRLLADDYYHFSLLKTGEDLFTLSVEKYLNVSNRYATMPLYALAEWIGIRWMPALMIVLWLVGLIWLLRLSTRSLPRTFALSISATILFLSILQAPNRFQSIYWISSSTTYFFPLVFYTFLFAVDLAFLRRPRAKLSLTGMTLFNLLATFFIGVLSETVGALNVAILFFVLLGFWLWSEKEKRIPATFIFSAALLGALISLAIMALSPANAIRSSDGAVGLPILIQRLFVFPYGFITNTFKTLPLPSIFTVLIGFLIFFQVKRETQKSIQIALLLAPLITFTLIAASFSPSAYALSYPDARVRFPARFVMTAGLFVEGALLGLLVARERFRVLATLLLAAAALYPLRGAYQACQSLPKYRAYADAWDTRDTYIQSKRDSGIMEIAVPPMDGMAGIKELDIDPNHWVNRGAADYYGVDAISVHSTSLDYDE